MFDLAERYGRGPISLKTVAERQNISDNYLEQLFAVLRKSGLLKSARGAQGGYVLAREPSAITVGDIIRAMEGPLALTDCVRETEPTGCEQKESCITRLVLVRVRDKLAEVMDSITLADMLMDAAQLASYKENQSELPGAESLGK